MFVRRLEQIRAQFGGEVAREKIALISHLKARKLLTVGLLQSYHESLCYLRAYADNATVLRLVDDELDRFKSRLRRVRKPLPKTARRALERSGMVGTKFVHDFGLQMVKWAMSRFPDAVDFDKTELGKLKSDPILDLLPVLVTWMENDAVDDPYVMTEDIRAAGDGERRVSFLRWFLDLFERLPGDENLKRLLFDKVAFPIRVDVANQPFARTHSREPVTDYYFQDRPLDRSYPDLRREVQRATLAPRLLKGTEGRKVIDRARMALFVRRRELWPLSFANEQEVWSAGIGHGTTIYLIGMAPDVRLPLEANYSALLIRNGVPIGYGVAAMVGERLELAINIFDTFRRCEAAFIYTKFLKILYQLFGCDYLIVRRYQVGYDNPEGLDSGAYWFYYKLGFRSLDSELRKLAEAEVKKIRSRRSYRTPMPVLKQLADSDLCLNLSRPSDYADRDFTLGQIALAQTRYISAYYLGDRNRAEREAPKTAAKFLGVRSMASWSKSERLWFKRWSVLVCALHQGEVWDAAAKRDLLRIIRAKGLPQEQAYVRGLLAHKRLKRALRALAADSNP